MIKKHTWAFIGCGWAASDMAQIFVKSGREIGGVYSRTYEKAVTFADKFNCARVYKSLEELCCDESISSVYIASPHSVHAQHIKACLQSGKNVLCEKAITMNISQLEELCGIASKKGVKLAEAMTTYNMPLHRTLCQAVSSGRLGKLNLIQVNFGSLKEYDMNNRFFNKEYAGGAILDIGVYALALESMYSTGEICEISSSVTMAPSGVDEAFGAVIKRKGGQISTVTVSLHSKLPKRCVISCEDAYIEIYDHPRADEARIYHNDGRCECVSIGNKENALLYEIENFEGDDDMLLKNTKEVMQSMTHMRTEWGLRYACED